MRAHAGHLKFMLFAGAAALGALWISGVSLSSALPYALLLACPVGMLAMMAMMGRGKGSCHDPAHHHGGATGTPQDDHSSSGQRDPAAPQRIPSAPRMP